jgi:hypothetical protein
MRKHPTSLGQLLGKSKWEKPLADCIMATDVGLVGQDMVDKEDERVEKWWVAMGATFFKSDG